MKNGRSKKLGLNKETLRQVTGGIGGGGIAATPACPGGIQTGGTACQTCYSCYAWQGHTCGCYVMVRTLVC